MRSISVSTALVLAMVGLGYLLSPETAFAQKATPTPKNKVMDHSKLALSISLALERELVSSNDGRLVGTVTIRNESPVGISLQDFEDVSINLSTKRRHDTSNLKRGYLYSSPFFVVLTNSCSPSLKQFIQSTIGAGETCKFSFNLIRLDWIDSLSSIINFDDSPGLESVPKGSYYAYFQMRKFSRFSDDRVPIGKIPLFDTYYSNEVDLTIK